MTAKSSSPDLELVRRACQVLLKIPGVLSVGIGHKVVNGQSTGQLALSIMVREKRPRSELPADELIPDHLEGLPTDIVEGGIPRLLIDEEEPEGFDAGIPRDEEEYRPILGGIQIRGGRSFTPTGKITFGTLGGFAITTGKDAGKRVLLTNHHVLSDKFDGINGPSCTGCTKGDNVGNPNAGSQIATLLRGENDPQVDAAIAILDSGVQFQRDIFNDDVPSTKREAIGQKRVLTTADVGLIVHKRGMRSRVTYGRVGAVGTTTPPIKGKTKTETKENQIRIDLVPRFTQAGAITFEAGKRILMPSVDFAAGGTKVGDLIFIVVPPNDGRYLITEIVDPHRLVLASKNDFEVGPPSQHSVTVTPCPFGLGGDSGSLVLDEQGHVVGLLWAADSARILGSGWANSIDAVEDRLKITIDSASTIGDTQVALASLDDATTGGAPATRLRPAAAVATEGPPATLRSMVENDLMARPRGREIYELYFTHHTEIRELIDGNRQVATVWHRQGGPGILQAVLDAVRSRTSEMPASIRGRTWAERVAAILAVFDTFGSAGLRHDIARFGRELEGLGGLTYPGFLERLEA